MRADVDVEFVTLRRLVDLMDVYVYMISSQRIEIVNSRLPLEFVIFR